MKKSALIRTAWGVAVVLVLLVLARNFVGDVYHVDSGSMEPTIHGLEDGGEWVFVRFDRDPPERNELAVFVNPSTHEPVVKRVVGLPFESVQIVQGDVWIDGAILRREPGDAHPRPWVCVYDQRWLPLESAFHMGSTMQNPWKQLGAPEQPGTWRVDATSVPPASDEGLAYYVPKLSDGWFAPDHRRVEGEESVNDAKLELDAFAESDQGRLRFELSEQGDLFELSIAPSKQELCPAVLTRRNASGVEVLARVLLPFAVGAWHRVRFSNCDNRIEIDVDEHARIVEATYERNALHPADRLREGKSLGPRVHFGGEGGRFRFRGVRVLRDLWYTPRGDHATKEAEELGPERYFLLGDNSAKSMDSRELGPIPRAQILGRAAYVVWPPSRWRKLEAPER